MQKIKTFLMFNNQTHDAVSFYVSVFKNSKIVSADHYGDDGPGPKGTMRSANFELEGQEFAAYDGGPHFSFAEGMSLFVSCETQEEVDRLYETLSEGGEQQPCGWVKDRFGVSWQVIPTVLMDLLSDPDPERAARATQAMLQMKKIDIAALQRAAGA
jgi:predicted 3-demethylubiquinone-9 3-methyltransferase (glyoxalase superfamily)